MRDDHRLQSKKHNQYVNAGYKSDVFCDNICKDVTKPWEHATTECAMSTTHRNVSTGVLQNHHRTFRSRVFPWTKHNQQTSVRPSSDQATYGPQAKILEDGTKDEMRIFRLTFQWFVAFHLV